MIIRYPDYYKKFRCIAAACSDSCCQEWEVDVDPEAAKTYLALEGKLGDDLRAVLKPGDGDWMSMAITADRRCPMWRRDGLCRIQAELGHEALCATCREFPRLQHDYGDFRELGLELSCPEAARLSLGSPDPAWTMREKPGAEAPDYNPRHMALLLESRAQVRTMLRELPVEQALAAILLYAYAVQEALDWDEEVDFSPALALAEAASLAQPGDLGEILDLYRELEILTPRWRALLDRALGRDPWTEGYRALARYLVDRYWLQAISDGDLVCRAKFVVTGCLTLNALGGDLVETAQLWSKEIENDADNVDALLDAAYTSPALADVKLLGLLLGK